MSLQQLEALYNQILDLIDLLIDNKQIVFVRSAHFKDQLEGIVAFLASSAQPRSLRLRLMLHNGGKTTILTINDGLECMVRISTDNTLAGTKTKLTTLYGKAVVKSISAVRGDEVRSEIIGAKKAIEILEGLEQRDE